jgi:hypothetical protein
MFAVGKGDTRESVFHNDELAAHSAKFDSQADHFFHRHAFEVRDNSYGRILGFACELFDYRGFFSPVHSALL